MKLIIVFCATLAFIECNVIQPCIAPNDVGCGKTIEVGVYIEALCPDSKDFVVNQLFPTFEKLSKSKPPIMTVNLVTFGNANMDFAKNATKNPQITFTCQHGEQECQGNILQSCAVLKYPIEQSLAFINCMFASQNWRTPWTSSAECAQKLKLDFNMLSECANSEDGLAIEYFMAGQTNNLNPAHTFVPWVTLDGQHTDIIQTKAQTDLLDLDCQTYPVVPKPDACNH